MFNSFFEDMGGGGHGGFHGHGRGGPSEDVDTEGMYKILGVEKDANANQVKKAYRKLAMKHHPDKGGDPEKFKEITKAHEILSDPEKREKYDKYGEKGLEAGGGGGGGSDIFSAMFGGRGGQQRGPRRGKDVQFRLQVQLEDLYKGATKSLRLTKNIVCKGCEGKGGKGVAKCGACKGRGVRMIIRQIGPGMIQQMQAHCDECEGEGEIIPPSGRCRECGGHKVVESKQTLKININKGMSQGSKVVFRGEAHQQPGIEPGDVVVILDCQEHSVFKRKGNHLFLKKKISLVEALTGFSFTQKHLDGRTLLLSSDDTTVYNDGCFKVIRDEGMPLETNPTQTGNLYIEFEVEFPKKLPDAAKKTLRKVLPAPPKDQNAVMADDEAEEVVLCDVDMDREREQMAQQRRADAYDSDDEGGGGAQQTQCRAQ